MCLKCHPHGRRAASWYRTAAPHPSHCPRLQNLEGDGLGAKGGARQQEEAKGVSQGAVGHEVDDVEALRVVGLGDEGRLLGVPAAHRGMSDTGIPKMGCVRMDLVRFNTVNMAASGTDDYHWSTSYGMGYCTAWQVYSEAGGMTSGQHWTDENVFRHRPAHRTDALAAA